MHLVDATEGWYVPEVQSEQLLAPSVLENVPAEQLSHCVWVGTGVSVREGTSPGNGVVTLHNDRCMVQSTLTFNPPECGLVGRVQIVWLGNAIVSQGKLNLQTQHENRSTCPPHSWCSSRFHRD